MFVQIAVWAVVAQAGWTCPESWLLLQGTRRCVKVSEGASGTPVAGETACAGVSPLSFPVLFESGKYAATASAVMEILAVDSIWSGATRQPEGQWQWADGTPISVPVLTTRTPSQRCGWLGGGCAAPLCAAECSETKPYVCQVEATEHGPYEGGKSHSRSNFFDTLSESASPQMTGAPPDGPVPNSTSEAASVVWQHRMKLLTRIASFSSVANDGRGLTLVSLRRLTCWTDDGGATERVDPEYHPTQTHIGTDAQRYLLGAIATNSLLFVSAMSVLCAAAALLKTAHGKQQCDRPWSWARAYAALRLPGVAFPLLVYTAQAVCFSAAQLIFYSAGHSAGETMVGCAFGLLCIAAPLAVYFCVVRALDDRCLYIMDADEDGTAGGWKRVYYAFMGEVVLVSRHAETHFAERFGMVCEEYAYGKAVFVCLEFGVAVALAVLSAWQPLTKGGCYARNTFVCVLLASVGLLLGIVRPYATLVSNVYAVSLSFTTFTAVLATTVSILFDETATGLYATTSAILLSISALLMLMRTVLFLVTRVYEYASDRKGQAREKARTTDRRGSMQSFPLNPRLSSSSQVLGARLSVQSHPMSLVHLDPDNMSQLHRTDSREASIPRGHSSVSPLEVSLMPEPESPQSSFNYAHASSSNMVWITAERIEDDCEPLCAATPEPTTQLLLRLTGQMRTTDRPPRA
ncbi:hypothetical protein DIPPA_17985 [Diplonema papillatum]|nr:hypothetical protein DIPPA_17985 [Diplonema papillatum]